jgi:5-methylcytosine-specific restriction protein A
MGKNRDQVLDGNQNRTLYDSRTNGVELHLFEVFHEGKYEYQGQVELAGEPYQDTQRDEQGVLRKVWMFPLKRK